MLFFCGKRTRIRFVKEKLFRILQLLIIAAILYLVFGRNLASIREALNALSLPKTVILLGAGCIYYLLEGAAYTQAFGAQRKLSLFRGVVLSFLGLFANVTTAGAGALPLQVLYLQDTEIPAAASAGVCLYSYILHKAAVLLLAAFCLLLGIGSGMEVSDLAPYLAYGFAAGTAITVILTLAACSTRINQLGQRFCEKMPERFAKQKRSLQENLQLLNTEVKDCFARKGTTLSVLLLDLLKFLSLCLLPALIFRFLQLPLPTLKAVIYTSLILALSGSLPNVSGLGPIEFAFLLFFGRDLPQQQVSSLLLVYRLANYFFPFLLSLPAVMMVRRKS